MLALDIFLLPKMAVERVKELVQTAIFVREMVNDSF